MELILAVAIITLPLAIYGQWTQKSYPAAMFLGLILLANILIAIDKYLVQN